MVAVSDEGAWSVTTPRLPLNVNGARRRHRGLFLAHTATDGPEAALSRTAASVLPSSSSTHAGGHREIRLVGPRSRSPSRRPASR